MKAYALSNNYPRIFSWVYYSSGRTARLCQIDNGRTNNTPQHWAKSRTSSEPDLPLDLKQTFCLIKLFDSTSKESVNIKKIITFTF